MSIIQPLSDQRKKLCVELCTQIIKNSLNEFLLSIDTTDIPTLAEKLMNGPMHGIAKAVLRQVVCGMNMEAFQNTELREENGDAKRHECGRERQIILKGMGCVLLPGDIYRYIDENGIRRQFSTLNQMGLRVGERIDLKVKTQALDLVADHSYRKTAALLCGDMSYGTVKNCLHQATIPEMAPPHEKRQATSITVCADEVHARLQKQEDERRSMLYPLAMIAEGREQVCGDRYRLVGKHALVAPSSSTKDLAALATAMISLTYNLDCLERIYVVGDGARWIQTMLEEEFPGLVEHSMDPYHRFKEIRALDQTFPHSKVKETVYKALEENNRDAFEGLIARLEKRAAGDAKQLKKVYKFRSYFTNNWEAMVVSVREDRPVSFSEPMVRHLGACRCTTLGMAWSPRGLSQILRLRAFIANGGDVDKIKIPPEGVQEVCPEYCISDNLIKEFEEEEKKREKELLDHNYNFNIFENTATPFDGNSGTGHRLRQLRSGGFLQD